MKIERIDMENSTIVVDVELPIAAIHSMVTRARDSIFKPNMKYTLTIAASFPIPTNIVMAIVDRHWKKAMDDEIEALKKNKIWILVERKANQNTLTSKWVYKCKEDDKGNLVHHKARLVVVVTHMPT